ncbi:hypothetical protein F5050DRAFT_1097041 [Lentinula boryana]|uniref:Uncharacterized protein n=1 Tax=Lentinula boryana TaxID=40481 RepID=A0ABQ8PZ86_9AGAR|nr:hypothetical protein F5050DRAFT_1097041 [Lentinula boryana]
MRLFPSSKSLSFTTSFVLTLGLVSIAYTTAMPTTNSKVTLSFPKSDKLSKIEVIGRTGVFADVVLDSIVESYIHFTKDEAFGTNNIVLGKEETPRLYRNDPTKYQVPFNLATEQRMIKGWIAFWHKTAGPKPGLYGNVKWDGINNEYELDIHHCHDLWESICGTTNSCAL